MCFFFIYFNLKQPKSGFNERGKSISNKLKINLKIVKKKLFKQRTNH